MSTKLYVLEQTLDCSSSQFFEKAELVPGNWVVDLGVYPFRVYIVELGQICNDITNTLIQPVDYWKVIDQWLREFTWKSGIHETLSINGYSFWWALGAPHFKPSISTLANSFAWIDILVSIQQKINPNLVVVVGTQASFEHVLQQIFVNAAIKYLPLPSAQETKDVARMPIAMRIFRLILSFLYFVFALIRHPEICFLSATSAVRSTTMNGKTELKDVLHGKVTQALRNEGWRTTVVEIPGVTTWRHLWARGWFFPNDVFNWLSHWRLLERGFYPRRRQRWKDRWQAENENIIKCMRYKGYDISPLLLPMVKKMFFNTAPSLEIMVDLWRFTLKLWRPELIYVNHSYGFSAIPLIVAAKSLGITTVEQQHGIIGENHIPYLVPAESDTQVAFPLCDYMITWGQQTKRLFVDRDIYGPGHVFVCGFPRLDKMLTAQRSSRSTTFEQLDIPLGAKMILYTSNPALDSHIHAVVSGMKTEREEQEVYWVIKMHPSQKSRVQWEEAVQEVGLQHATVIKGEVDFHALLTACDLHISFVSTTFIESALLEKPNLGLHLPYYPDPTGLLEAGAYRPVQLEEIGKTAYDILSEPALRASLIQEQSSFAQDWCRFDGQSVNRIVKALTHLIDRND
jgi:hypothetical protein